MNKCHLPNFAAAHSGLVVCSVIKILVFSKFEKNVKDIFNESGVASWSLLDKSETGTLKLESKHSFYEKHSLFVHSMVEHEQTMIFTDFHANHQFKHGMFESGEEAVR